MVAKHVTIVIEYINKNFTQNLKLWHWIVVTSLSGKSVICHIFFFHLWFLYELELFSFPVQTSADERGDRRSFGTHHPPFISKVGCYRPPHWSYLLLKRDISHTCCQREIVFVLFRRNAFQRWCKESLERELGCWSTTDRFHSVPSRRPSFSIWRDTTNVCCRGRRKEMTKTSVNLLQSRATRLYTPSVSRFVRPSHFTF